MGTFIFNQLIVGSTATPTKPNQAYHPEPHLHHAVHAAKNTSSATNTPVNMSHSTSPAKNTALAADDASEYTVFDKDVSSVHSKTGNAVACLEHNATRSNNAPIDKKSKTKSFLSKFTSSSPSSKTPNSDYKPNWEARATH